LRDVERGEDLVSLAMATPSGEIIVDVRVAFPGANAFKTADGIAYSYRRGDRDMPAVALRRLEAVIAHLRRHASALHGLLGASVSPVAVAVVSERESPSALCQPR
jgi:hypothetical protein